MDVEVIRSPRRRKTISAERRNGKLVVRIPARISKEEERDWVRKMVDRVLAKERATRLNAGRALERAADRLNRRYFDGALRWQSIHYVSNQSAQFGSCTPEDGAIRISHRVADLPSFVRDYVVMHELVHLVEARHDAVFRALVDRYPLAERARGYLMALGLEP